MYEDVRRTHACVDRGPPGGDWLAVDSALPNMGQSRRSIHKTTGRAAARLSSCATPTHCASFNNHCARANTLSVETYTQRRRLCKETERERERNEYTKGERRTDKWRDRESERGKKRERERESRRRNVTRAIPRARAFARAPTHTFSDQTLYLLSLAHRFGVRVDPTVTATATTTTAATAAGHVFSSHEYSSLLFESRVFTSAPSTRPVPCQKGEKRRINSKNYSHASVAIDRTSFVSFFSSTTTRKTAVPGTLRANRPVGEIYRVASYARWW